MSIRNFDALFDPGAIAVIGASNTPGSVGSVLAQNLYGAGFAGPIMAVNPHASAIRSALSYQSVAELPVTPDLAVLATPARSVPGLIADLGRRGCRAAVVISAGFGEADQPAGLRQQLLDAAKPHLLRIIGPNCLGFISARRRINASFAHLTPHPGNIALVSQSGAIIAALLDWADQRGIGFSHVVSLGDMNDVDVGDMLDYLCGDATTRSILLYVENVTHARKFMSAARAAGRTKPVIVVKAGRSAAGAKAALSHTGALAGADIVYDAAFRRAGLLRVSELDELFAAAAILASGVRVSGERMAILTNGGGAGVLAVDAITAGSGTVATLDPATIARLDKRLPAAWSRANPIDILGDATGERYASALEALLEGHESDAVLVINCPTAVADGVDAARAVASIAQNHQGVPVLTSWLGGRVAQRSRAILSQNNLPTFESPEEAVRAFGYLADFRRNQALLLETPAAGVMIAQDRIKDARKLFASVRRDKRSALTEAESKQLLTWFGIPTVRTVTASSPEEAARAFPAMKGRAVLKILSPDITHKSDVSGVALDLSSAEEIEAAGRAMLAAVAAARPEARIAGFTLQPMIVRRHAQELITGIAQDPTFGPVILFGSGGKATEIVGDRTIGLPPLNSVLARDMIGGTRIARLLAGFRDAPATPLEPVIEVLLRLSELAVLLPEIRELDINPLLANAEGVIALDARVVIAERKSDGAGLSVSPYPRDLEHAISLDDGTLLHLRPIRPEDETALAGLVARCAPEDIRMRFFGPLKGFPHELAARLSQIDYDREMAFIAVEPGAEFGTGPIFGVVRIVGDPERETAEFAILVRTDIKGRGLGSRLMSEIIGHAREKGYRTVFGHILRENRGMLRMAGELGFDMTSDPQDMAIVRATLALRVDDPDPLASRAGHDQAVH
ncbi:bifunctional acetate--CoA ligase family protein/GNAT family N-acetyltransferase [Bosea lathyri]|uniref:Acetyltransferase n=1 Tax=Bosea lathyri TaxID=1036778 RepID=A0A1H6CWD8_9HYPH|nr:bifunctional acetate--CoA ligase family protein/GNAT family N-acetyltransferase [Bosea lathyri]SEG76855.1 acetyltransferase [Bosea lathyri]